MRHGLRRWIIPIVVLGLAPVLSTHGTASELTAKEVVRRHVEALGGKQKLAAIESLRKAGTYAYNGLEHPFVSYHKPGGRCREEIEGLQIWGTSIKEGHKVVRGTDGQQAWIQDESRPPEVRPISAPRAALMLEEADLFGALVDRAAKGHRVDLVGRGDVEGTSTHHLRVVLASGIALSWHLDEESYLVLRKEVEIEPGSDEQQEFELPRAWQFDDYRAVNGVLMPFWVYVEERVFAREYLYETIEANVEIDEALFAPPPGATAQRPE